MREKHLAAVLAVVFTLLASIASALTYQAVDIAPLDGYISDINSYGVLVGTMTLSDGVSSRGFTWDASSGFVYLEPLSGYANSRAVGINDSGQVVGSCRTPGGSTTLWNPEGSPLDIGSFGATAINNAGHVAGSSYFWSDSGGLEYIGASAYANAINDSDVVVGERSYEGFIWTRETGMQLVYSPEPGMGFPAVAINNLGQVVFQTSSLGVSGMSYLWLDGTELMPLGTLSGAAWTSARDINNLGQIVGASGNLPFVWDSANGMQALPLLPGLTMGAAVAINDSGLIAGYAFGDGSPTRLVLWQPVPEPSSLLALGGGAFGLAGMALRRRTRTKM